MPLRLVLVLILCGCAPKVKSLIAFDPAQPIRIAVLPFHQVERGKIIPESYSPNIFIDNIPLLSSKIQETPASLIQGIVETELRKNGFDLLSNAFVRTQLGHHGFVEGSKVKVDELRNAEEKRLGELLSADAILYGSVSKWRRRYWGLESSTTVGVELKLVSAADGREIFVSEGEDTDVRGITGIPTGLFSLIFEPIRALDSDNILKLGERLVKRMLKPLSIKDRDDYLNSAGPAIYGAVHTDRVSEKESLVVLLLGSPEQEGQFSLSATQRYPLYEIEPGKYVGNFRLIQGERLELKEVVVTLKDRFGRKVAKTLPAPLRIE